MASSSYDDLSYDQLVLGNNSNITDSHNKPSLKQNKLSLSDSPSTPFSILQAEFKQEEESFSSAPRTTLFPQIFQQFSTFDNNVDAYLNSSSSFSDDQPSFENDFDARISMCEKEMEQVRKQVDQLSKRIITIDMVMNNQVPSSSTTTTTCEKISNKTKDDTSLADLKQTIVETSQNGDDGDLCYKNNNNNTKNDNNNTSLCIKSDNNYHNHHHHNDLDSANEQSDDSRDSSSASSAASPNDYSYFPSSYRRYNSNYNYTDDDMRDYTNTSISSNESLEEETLKSIQGDHNLSLIKHDINNVKKNINPILKAFKQTFETNNNNRFTPPFYVCKDESLLMPSTPNSTTSNNNKIIQSKQNYSKFADNDNSTASSFKLKNQNSKFVQKEEKESNKNEISFFNLFKKMLIQRLAKSLHKFDLKTQIQAQSFIELHKRILLFGNDKNNENDDKKSFQQKQKDGDETENEEEQEEEDLMSPIWEDEFEMKAFADDDSCDDDDSYDTDNDNHNTNDKNNCQKHKKEILDLDDPIQRQDFLETTFQYLESLE